MTESSLDALQALLLIATLWTAGLGLGMSVRIADVLASLRRPTLVARTVTLDVVLIPVAMWVAVRLLLPNDDIGTGLLLVAFASAGPLGIKLASVAHGDVGYAIGIVVVLEIVNVAAIPIWSSLLGVAGTTGVVLDIVRTLVLLVILPLGVGMLIVRRWPMKSPRWVALLGRVSNLGVVAIVAFLVIRNLDVIEDAQGSGALVAVGVVILFALAAGWVLGGPERPTRVTTSLVTGVRANAAAIAIATTTFAGTPAVAIGVIVAGLASVAIPSVFAMALRLATRGQQRP